MENTERKFIVYKHTSPDGKIYIGMTSEPTLEKRSGSKGIYYKKNKKFYDDIQKFGWGKFLHEVLFADLEQTQAQIMEISLIHFYQSNNPEFGYNTTKGGELSGTTGKHFKQTEETKKRISDSQSGEKGYWYGKELTEEHRNNISKSQTGKKHKTETKSKMSESAKSFQNTPEQRAHTSATSKYYWRFGKGRKPIFMIEYKYISL